jgi:hypothetical protein
LDAEEGQPVVANKGTGDGRFMPHRGKFLLTRVAEVLADPSSPTSRPMVAHGASDQQVH